MPIHKIWKVLTSILPLAPGSPLSSAELPAPPDSGIVYKVVSLASGQSVARPAPEPRCPPVLPGMRRVRDRRGVVVSITPWQLEAAAAPFFAKAESARAAGRLEEAAEAYARGLALSPEYGPGWVAAGDVQSARKDHAGALGFYRKALALDPSLVQAHRSTAGSLFRLGKLAEAEDESVQALIYDPNDEAVWRALETDLGPKAGFTVHRPPSIPSGAIGANVDGTVEIGVPSPEWLPYLRCKARWRHEEAYRQTRLAAAPWRYSRSISVDGSPYSWSVAEEVECLHAYVEGNRNATPLARTLVQVEEAKLLDGFILFALFGRRCPGELALLSSPERGQIERFIRKFVIVRPR